MLGAIHRDEVADLFATASVVLVPSVDEPFGLVALEAAASGIPIVASRAGGLPEAVGPGGLLLASRDPTEWAAVIGGLLDDESHRAAFGAAGPRPRRTLHLGRGGGQPARDLRRAQPR